MELERDLRRRHSCQSADAAVDVLVRRLRGAAHDGRHDPGGVRRTAVDSTPPEHRRAERVRPSRGGLGRGGVPTTSPLSSLGGTVAISACTPSVKVWGRAAGLQRKGSGRRTRPGVRPVHLGDRRALPRRSVHVGLQHVRLPSRIALQVGQDGEDGRRRVRGSRLTRARVTTMSADQRQGPLSRFPPRRTCCGFSGDSKGPPPRVPPRTARVPGPSGRPGRALCAKSRRDRPLPL